MFNQNILYNVVITIVVSVIATVVVFLKWRMNYWNRRDVCSLPTNVLFGNSKSLVFGKESLGTALANFYKHFKTEKKLFGGYYFLFRPIFIPVNLEVIKNILITDFEYFTDRVFHYSESDILSAHLVGAKGSVWKQLRTILSPAFTPAKNKLMFGPIEKCVDNLIEQIDQNISENKPVEMKQLAGRMSIDVIGLCAYGVESNCLKNSNSNFVKYSKKCFDPSRKTSIIRLFMVLYPEIMNLFNFQFSDADTAQFFLNVAEETIKHREYNKVVRNDLINLLLQIKDEQSKTLNKNNSEIIVTKELIAAQCFFFLIAGYEAVSTTITLCLLELGLNQEIQKILRAEIKKSLNGDKELTYDNVMNMSYLDKCVKETLRKYPPTPLVFRECTKTYKVPNSSLTIEKGVAVFIPLLGIHMDPEFFPDPEAFIPDRFSKENEQNRHTCAYMPFGNGPRNCIAYKFGLLQVKFTIAKLITKYTFSVNSRTTVPIVMDNTSIVLRPLDGVWLNIKEIL